MKDKWESDEGLSHLHVSTKLYYRCSFRISTGIGGWLGLL